MLPKLSLSAPLRYDVFLEISERSAMSCSSSVRIWFNICATALMVVEVGSSEHTLSSLVRP